MARKNRAQSLGDDEPELNISSLIDICFLLLIYFLVTTTIKARETDTNMELPAQAPSEDVPEINPLFIRVGSDGIIYLNTGSAQETLDSDPDSRKLPLLASRLESYVGRARIEGNEPLVQIYVEGDAKHQRAIDVLDALRGEGISKVTFTDLVNE
jgi:biopolymer transport protein ExbD